VDCLVGRTNELRTGNPLSNIRSLLVRCVGLIVGSSCWLSLLSLSLLWFGVASSFTVRLSPTSHLITSSPSPLVFSVLHDDSDSAAFLVLSLAYIFGDSFLWQ